MRISRRDFVKSATASGIVLSIRPGNRRGTRALPRARRCRGGKAGIPPPPGSVASTASPRLREPSSTHPIFVQPISRTGRQATSHAMLIRAADATHVYDGLDLSRLSGALKPSVVVTAADLARIGVRVPEFYAGDLLCPVGKTPLYLGQPVALLIFEDFDAFDQARLALRDEPVLKFGKETGPVTMPNYGAFRFTRVAGPTPDAPDVYSPAKNGWVSPERFERHGAPDMGATPDPDRTSLCRSRDLWRTDPRGTCREQSGTSGAGPRIRDAVGRPDGSRAGKRPCLV